MIHIAAIYQSENKKKKKKERKKHRQTEELSHTEPVFCVNLCVYVHLKPRSEQRAE